MGIGPISAASSMLVRLVAGGAAVLVTSWRPSPFIAPERCSGAPPRELVQIEPFVFPAYNWV